jgi:hypothetical protein
MKPDSPLIHAITYCYSTIPNAFPLNARTFTLNSSLPYALHPLVIDLIHSATQHQREKKEKTYLFPRGFPAVEAAGAAAAAAVAAAE